MPGGDETHAAGTSIPPSNRPNKKRFTVPYEKASWTTSARSIAALNGSSTRRPKELEEAIDEALADHPITTTTSTVSRSHCGKSGRRSSRFAQNGENIEITGDGLKPAQSGLLSDKAAPKSEPPRASFTHCPYLPKTPGNPGARS